MSGSLTVTPDAAARAYGATARGEPGGSGGADGFGGALARAIEGAVQTGHAADAASVSAIGGGGNLNEVVTAVAKAELAMQTASAVRDRVVQAYQDIMHMAI